MDNTDLLASDLKAERGNLSDGLSAYFRVVPVLFYVTVLGSIALLVFFSTATRKLAADRDGEISRQGDQMMVTDELAGMRFEIDQENVRASAVADWIETAQGLQPLVAALARSVDSDSSIDTLSLKRNPEILSQIFLVLRLNGDVQEQIDESMAAVRELNYRSFSAKQSQGDGILDYDTTLMAWHENLSARWPEIPHYDERFKRTWNYYLQGSAAGFRSRSVQLWQVMFTPSRQRRPTYHSVR